MKINMLMRICLCVALQFFSVDAFSAPVPDTGQTKCYDVAGNVITCPSPGQPFYGQDANYNINPMSYTKLDSNGNGLPDSATSWVMVRDNVTGLIWEVKTNKDGVQNYNDPHDADNLYTWYDSNPATNGGDPGFSYGNGMDTEAFINALNSAHCGGYSDWRLPTIKELTDIVNYSIPYPGTAINTQYFPDIQPAHNWSSTTNIESPNCTWSAHFGLGYTTFLDKSISNYTCAVRGVSRQPSFMDNDNGTVTDSSTGLMWQQAIDGNRMTWDQALPYCKNLNFEGYTDWRLPTIKELRSLIDYSHYNPSINTNTIYFSYDQLFGCWSSTTCVFRPDNAWGMEFYIGGEALNDKIGINYGYYVRAVRGGQSQLPDNLIILSPNQAAIWDIGSQKVISWNTQGIEGNVSISISSDGGKTYSSIADATPNNGSYPWMVAGPASGNCMIKIEPLSDLTKGTVQGLFTIFQPILPESQVLPLASVQRPISKSFEVKWTGTGAVYNLFVSEDGKSYLPWIANTTETSAVFTGGKLGSTYSFYSVAADNAGNMEATPTVPDATTRLLPSGAIDSDSDVDQDDLNLLLADRNKTVANSSCGIAGDLDWDGMITVLDARILTTLFTRPGGATK